MFRNVTVHDVAIHFGLSDDYINRAFSKSEHITLKAYINKLRVKQIEEYLISTNTSLEVVAKKLSFPNVSALSKFYKYHTGRTITEFRSRFFN
jgi:AraC-like DNA-binding protein